jgi:ribonuclease BN (tRNA processing enzyme)
MLSRSFRPRSLLRSAVKITFLGSGGAFTDFRVNYHNNALVETDEGPVLLDCGATAVQSMRELGVHPTDIRAVLFTHLHADHASPEQLVWERYYTSPDGGPAYKRTPFVAPASLLGPLRTSLAPFIDIYTDPDGILHADAVDALIEFLPCESATIGGVHFRYFRVPHTVGITPPKAAFGLEISSRSGTVFWSGDTTFSLGWIQDAAAQPGVQMIFHECLFSEPYRGTIHTHWQQLLTLPDDARRKLTLMHHTAVPEGVSVSPVCGAAARHQVFDFR